MKRAQKLFIGRKVRDLRQSLEGGSGVTQMAFAERLGISTSYLNQIESNQRPVTATVLLALASEFNLSVRDLSLDDSDRLLSDVREALSDPVFGNDQISLQDLKLLTQNAPAVAHALLKSHQAFRRAQEQIAELDDAMVQAGGAAPTPYEEVRDFFHYNDNYIHELDVAAENFAAKAESKARGTVRAFADDIERRYRVNVQIAADEEVIRAYEPVASVKKLSPVSPPSTHAFQIAHQIALLQEQDVMDRIVEAAQFHSEKARQICRIGLANYFAGAAVLPYERFMSAALEERYDLERLALRFGASLEQVAHRLSTLQRPNAKGIPFFFARVDQAGNITKRHSATKLQFARFGAACPLWNAHLAFETPGRIIRQLAETPDGVRYLCLAVEVRKQADGFRAPVRRYALALGCEVTHAENMIYADGLDLGRDAVFEPLGVSCRICERENCHQRAVPPLNNDIDVDLNNRGYLPYRLS